MRWVLVLGILVLGGCSSAPVPPAGPVVSWTGACSHLNGTVQYPAIAVHAQPYPEGWELAEERLAWMSGRDVSGASNGSYSERIPLDDRRCAALHVPRGWTVGVYLTLNKLENGMCPQYRAFETSPDIPRKVVEDDLYELEAVAWEKSCYAT